MPPFPFAWAEGDAPATLAMRCLEQLEPLPGGASLGLLYATGVIGGRLDEALEVLRAARPGVTWIGTVGDGLSVTGREIYDTPALAVMVTDLPREQLLLETDCPYLGPERGVLNEPCNVAGTAEKAAELWETTVAEAQAQLEDNFTQLFGAPP